MDREGHCLAGGQNNDRRRKMTLTAITMKTQQENELRAAKDNIKTNIMTAKMSNILNKEDAEDRSLWEFVTGKGSCCKN